MATFLFLLKHHRLVGPGWLLDRCNQETHPYRILTVTRPDDLPMAVECQGVVLAGLSLSREDLHGKNPLVRAQVQFVRSLIALGVPYLGIDRGAQILARAMLAAPLQEAEAPSPPAGPVTVPLTSTGRQDPLLGGPAPLRGIAVPTVRFEIPAKAELLAGTPEQPEAFRFGACAWGIYPHVELTAQGFGDWLSAHPEWVPDRAERAARAAEALRMAGEQQTYAHGMMDRFLSHCRGFCHTPEPLAQIHPGPDHCNR